MRQKSQEVRERSASMQTFARPKVGTTVLLSHGVSLMAINRRRARRTASCRNTEQAQSGSVVDWCLRVFFLPAHLSSFVVFAPECRQCGLGASGCSGLVTNSHSRGTRYTRVLHRVLEEERTVRQANGDHPGSGEPVVSEPRTEPGPEGIGEQTSSVPSTSGALSLAVLRTPDARRTHAEKDAGPVAVSASPSCMSACPCGILCVMDMASLTGLSEGASFQ